MRDRPPESLWILIVGPTIWALHFLLSYVFAAVYCAKAADPDGGLAPIRMAVAGFTAVALVALGIAAVHSWRRAGRIMHASHDEPEDRRSFMAMATLLLCGLSGVGTIYVASVVLFFDTCR
ncbi:hypothetical protein BH24PSE2_BH24PSE2_08260 [soil metagenome]